MILKPVPPILVVSVNTPISLANVAVRPPPFKPPVCQ